MRSQLVACAALACVAIVGCSRVSENAQLARSTTIPGTLRYSVNGVGSLNPLTQTNTNEVLLDMFIYGWFFYVDDKGRFVPDLATEVPSYANGGISRDGRTLTYHLRRGVRWQDGAPFTSHDAAFTVSAIMNPRNNIFSRTGWDDIASTETPDAYTVRFHLKQPYAPALATFFVPYQHSGYPMLPAHLLERYPDLNEVSFNGAPIGTGPFKVTKWVRGDRIELEANPLYWRGPPKLTRIVVKIIPDDNTALTQFKTHEIDAIFAAPLGQYPQLAALPDAKVLLVPSSAFDMLVMNTRRPPLDDLRVRRAIAEAIDKRRIIDNITHGVGTPADSDIVGVSWAHAAGLPSYAYDPTAAAALLGQAGWLPGPDGIRVKSGKRLTLNLTTIAKDATRVGTVLMIQDQLRAVGIAAEVKNYPAELVYGTAADGGVLMGGRYDLGEIGQNTGIDPDDSTLFMCDQIPPAGVNESFWCDAAFDAAERAALTDYDQAARTRSYAVTQRRLVEQVPVVFLYYQRLILVVTPRLHGLAPTPSQIFNWNTWEWSMQ